MLAALSIPAALGLAGLALWVRDNLCAPPAAAPAGQARAEIDGLNTAILAQPALRFGEIGAPDDDTLVLLSISGLQIEERVEWEMTLEDILDADRALAAYEAERDREDDDVAALDALYDIGEDPLA